MPIAIHYLDDGLGFELRGWGYVSGKDILCAIAERFSSEEKMKRYRYGIADYTAVEEFDVSNREIDLIVQEDLKAANINPHMILALAASDDLVFGLSRMFAGIAEQSRWCINVFRSAAEAAAWVKKRANQNHHWEPSMVPCRS
jgi:hypothetical protein